jgi:hypothetical protein
MLCGGLWRSCNDEGTDGWIGGRYGDLAGFVLVNGTASPF